MPGFGHRGKLRLFGETAYGNNTANALGAEYISFESEGMDVKPEYVFVKGIRASRDTFRKIQGPINAKGNLKWQPDVEDGIGIFLKNILPLEEFTNLGAGNGGQHVFKVGDTQLPPSIAMRINRDTVADAGNIWDFTGGRISKISFSADEGKPLECSVDLVFQNGVSGAADFAPSYTTQNPLMYWQGSLTIGGQTIAAKSFKLDIDAGLISARGQLGSQLIQQPQPGSMKVSGEIDAYFDSLQYITDFLQGNDVAIALNFSGSALGTSTRQLEFLLPVAGLIGTSPTIQNMNEIMQKLPFQAWRNGNGSPDETIVVTLLNSVQQSY